MAKFDKAKFIENLHNKWKDRPCPLCGSGPWMVQDTTFQIMEYNEAGLVLGGGVILPLVPVICGNCGYTALVSPIIAGVMPPFPPVKEDQK
jgi:ribosomal protein S27AE